MSLLQPNLDLGKTIAKPAIIKCCIVPGCNKTFDSLEGVWELKSEVGLPTDDLTNDYILTCGCFRNKTTLTD